LLELKGQSLTHDAFGIHGIHQCIDLGRDQVALSALDGHDGLIVPTWSDDDSWLMGSTDEELTCPLLGHRRSSGDFDDGCPRKEVTDEELGLALFFHLTPIRRRHDVPPHLGEVLQVLIVESVRELSMTIGESPWLAYGGGTTDATDEMHDSLLTAGVVLV